MQLTFTKRAGKMDGLVVVHDDGSRSSLDCPKQGMIPHEMVHYAVESVLRARGFLSRIGAEDYRAMTPEAAGEAVERMVETIQADVWSGGAPVDEVIDLYQLGCEARGHPALPVNADAVVAIRATMDDLAARWAATPLHGSLTLSFEAVG
jgi:hypothetical protein